MAMQYSYEAMTGGGQAKSGTAAAASTSELRRQLREQGLFLVRASELSSAVAERKRGFSFVGKRISKADILNMTSQLAIMAQAGIDLASALQMLAMECQNESLKRVLESVHERVSAGEAVHEALRKQSQVFGEAYVASVAAGEAGGNLPQVLNRLAQLLRADIRLRGALRAMIAYPAVLVVVSGSVLVALVFFVLPTFSEVFENMGVTLPMLTQVMLDVSRGMMDHYYVLVAVVVAAVFGLRFLLKNPIGRQYWDRAILRIPILQGISRYLNMGRAFRLLGTMVESGVPLMEGLGFCQSSIRNSVYRGLFQEIRQDVLGGSGMAAALSRSPYVPPAAGSMIATGERTGSLGRVLDLLGEHYENEAETRFRDFATILEPALVVMVGGLVATVVLSLVLPMFDFTAIGNAS